MLVVDILLRGRLMWPAINCVDATAIFWIAPNHPCRARTETSFQALATPLAQWTSRPEWLPLGIRCNATGRCIKSRSPKSPGSKPCEYFAFPISHFSLFATTVAKGPPQVQIRLTTYNFIWHKFVFAFKSLSYLNSRIINIFLYVSLQTKADQSWKLARNIL